MHPITVSTNYFQDLNFMPFGTRLLLIWSAKLGAVAATTGSMAKSLFSNNLKHKDIGMSNEHLLACSSSSTGTLDAMDPMESWKKGLHVLVKMCCLDCAFGFDLSPCTLWAIQRELQYSEEPMVPWWAYISLCKRKRCWRGKSLKVLTRLLALRIQGKGLRKTLSKTRRQRNKQWNPHVSFARTHERTIVPNTPHGVKEWVPLELSAKWCWMIHLCGQWQ